MPQWFLKFSHWKHNQKIVWPDTLNANESDPNLLERILHVTNSGFLLMILKQNAMHWNSPSSSRAKKFERANLNSKQWWLLFDLCIFTGILKIKVLINNNMYTFLLKICKRIRKDKSWILHQDSVLADCSMSVKRFLAKYRIHVRTSGCLEQWKIHMEHYSDRGGM